MAVNEKVDILNKSLTPGMEQTQAACWQQEA